MATGVIGRDWYAVLTGVAMLYLAWVLSSALAGDPVSPLVAALFVITGGWQLASGVRGLRRRRTSPG